MEKFLEVLFEDWKKKPYFNAKGQKGQFIPDGVVCVDTYMKSSIKVLFVLKDANDETPEIVYSRGICDEVLESDNSGETWNRIAEWSRALVDGNTDFVGASDLKKESCAKSDEKDGMRKYYKKVAIMNLKKASGEGNADPQELEDYAGKDADEIIKEIKICNPDVIIACSRDVFLPLQNKVFKNECKVIQKINLNEKMKNYGNCFDVSATIGSEKHIYVVEYCHPNNRGRGVCTAEEHYQNMLQIRKFILAEKER